MFSRREFLPISYLFARSTPSYSKFLTYDQALQTCHTALPARGEWPRWIQRHDATIRSRLLRGEEDSLVNFVLFGVSFTNQPQLRAGTIPALPNRDGYGAATDDSVIDARVRDFIQALHNPGNNERLLWLRHRFGSRTESWIRAAISRYLTEQNQYRQLLDKAPANDPAVGELYKNRGLSIDTTFRPNWAIEQALAELKRRGSLTSVRRAAIIGPGLDFTDKDSGFDYYPLQTLQPFGLADSLLRLGLARLPDLRISVFDISAQTLDHISRAVRRGHYTIQLVLDETRPWHPDVLAYWRRFGDRIGTPAEASPPPSQVRNVLRRAVEIRPEIVKLLQPVPLNIVTQRPAGNERYDLVLATNVLVYYDAFDRALVSLNIESMMSASGIFLSNSPMPDCPAAKLHPIGNVDVEYSAEPGDDDRIEMYSNSRFGRALGPR